MGEMITNNMDDLLMSVPGGTVKLVLDDQLTVLSATDSFYSLIKNATVKVNSKTSLALTRIVYSMDIIYLTQQLALQRSRKDNMINLNFRILQPNGSFKWIMISGNKTEEVYPFGSKSVPVYACIAMDTTDHMDKYKKIEQELGYQHIISELSRDLFFVYEIATDTMFFKELFREIFGKDNVIKNFSSKLEKTKLIYPVELPAIIKIFKSIMGGKKQVRFEIRLISKEGIPAWYVCYASIIFDENKNPYRIIGKLATNPIKSVMEAAPMPQLDPLTKVFTKDFAENMIIETMDEQNPESLSALMLFEVRNYKIVNEVMKAMNGENILTTIAGFLKTRFRSSDTIGRLGTSEFIVYMRDIKEDINAYDKVEKICKEVEGLYSFEHIRNGLAVSIGIAFTRGEPLDYPTLLTNAKAALLLAKEESSSSFEVYNK